MKTKLLKGVFTLALTLLTLPMMSQDCLKIYFNDGSYRSFFLRDITEIFTSVYNNKNNIHHITPDFQYIVTLDNQYIYDIATIDSITFTKFDEEKAAKNFLSAASVIESILRNNSNSHDISNNIDIIKQANGVEDAWTDEHELNVKIAGWETISYHLDHDDDDDANSRAALARETQMLSRLSQIPVKSEEKPLKVVIANQPVNDEDRIVYVTDHYIPLMKEFVKCRVAQAYETSPTIEFFCSDFFSYDIIFLVTHGGLFNMGTEESPIIIHKLITSSYLGECNLDQDPSEEEWQRIHTTLDNLRNIFHATDQQIMLSACKEKRGGQDKRVYYASITEPFLQEKVKGHFKNSNSIFFNCSCSSLAYNHNFAQQFFDKGLGIYMGYDGSNSVGKKAGPHLFTSMLNGHSFAKAWADLPYYYRVTNNNTTFLHPLTDGRDEEIKSLFLFPTYTNELSDEQATSTFNTSQFVEIEGMATSSDIDAISYGFVLGTDEALTNGQFLEANNKGQLESATENGNIFFKTKINELKYDQTYYYCAYTYDGVHYNYGKTYDFKIEKPEEPSSDDVNLVKNGDMEGTDVSNFFVKINAGDINPAVISNGVGVNGSRGIKVAATARVSETWDNQFWVRLNRPVSAGTKYRFSFNYRADKSADVSTEYHAEPSEYIDWGEYITFTSAWKSYSKEGIITSSQSKTDMPFQSIAFTLNNYSGANNYYFDNIKFEVLTEEEEPPVDLKLSSTAPISLEVGEGATLEILSGNGGYNAKSDKENVATAAIKHETTVVIVATGPGEATITVSDKSGKTKKISVTVKDSSASGWINLVNNSDMEGTDVSSFYERTGTWEIDPYLATISNGVGINGSRGIKVEATQKVDEIWDNQFWVRFNQPISERTKYRFSFNYRADKNAEVREEFHSEPSEYLDWISDYINFTTNWQTFSQEGVVESNQSKDDMPFQSVAFTLNVFEGANNYYFDNIKFEVILDGQCPKPTFKLNGNKLTIQSPFTTRIYYTLDGTTPTTRSSVYTSPLALNQSCIVKAIAVVDASNISPVAAYTYSGEETFADLALSSTDPISMEVGESKTITITSGSGSYDVVSSASSVASVERSGNTITIKGKSAGTATITVTDTKTGQTMPVKVNVKSVEIPDASIIAFTDPLVKEICVKNWDTNGDGELSKSEAAAVTSFPLWAFASRDITSFNELQYFTGLKSIGWRAFESCSSLASIIIPNSVTSIEGSAFRECENLSSITIGNNVTSIGDEAFSDCYSLSSITIPNSVKSIGEYAFNECSRLASIIIPNSVTKIGFGAFFQCESLTSATIGNNVKSIEGWVFSGCEKLSSISIGNSVTSIGEEAFADCGSLTSFTIPNSVTTIGTYAFEGCEGLTSLTIGNSVTNIGKGAFRKCSSLISVTIPNSVKSIGDLAFQNCSNLTSIVIPNSVTSIGSEAFYECERLTSVTIPNSVTSIKNGTFKRCHNLSSITIPNSVTTIGSNAFYECHSLTSIVIPNSVTSIDPYAFYECKSLTSVTIPNSVKSIGNRAFEYCSGLTSITIGNSVTSFGYEAFAYCKNAETVISYIKEPFEIDTDVFQGLPKDATLFVPAGTKAKYGAFKGWTVIKNIVEMK